MRKDEKIRSVVDSIHHKYKVASLLFLLLFAGPTFAQELPFAVGEKLVYNARWLMFDAGRVEMEVSQLVAEDGRKLMNFMLRTTTTNAVASVFTMDDYFWASYDTERNLPEKLIVKIRESTTKKDKFIDFIHDGGIAVVVINGREPVLKELDPKAQNFLTSGYFTRTKPLKVKDRYTFPVFEDNKNYNAVMEVLKKSRIRLMGGEVDTILVQAKLKFEGAFWGTGKILFWLTDDKYKIPVKIKLKMWAGTITATLVKASGVKLNIIKKKK